MHLPCYLDGFFGREAEQQAVLKAVAHTRLVTIVGSPGVGKTRLAIECAAAAPGFAAVQLVPLQGCSDGAAIADQLHAVLDLRPGKAPPLDQVADALAGRRVLLVLDNLEHLVGRHCRATITALLDRLPMLHLLATSRRALGGPQEHVVPLRGLPHPEGTDPEELAAQPAVQLFADRARRVRADFRVHAVNAGMVAALCRRFDGLPFALEIAAAQVRRWYRRPADEVIGDSLLYARADGRTRGGDRQLTLDEVIGASWALLGAREHGLLRVLATFSGGATEAAAAAVSGLPGAAMRAALHRLVAHSLAALATDAHGARRIHLQASVRDCAAARTDSTEGVDLRQRHRHWCLQHAHTWAARHQPVPAADWPDLNLALVTAEADGDLDAGLALARTLRWQWMAHGAPQSTAAALQRLAQALPPGTAGAALLHCLLARLLLRAGDGTAARRAASRALALAGTDTAARAEALLTRATVAMAAQGPTTALLAAARQAERAAAGGPPDLRARVSILLGAILSQLRTPAAAEQHLAAAEACFDSAASQFAALHDEHGLLWARCGRIACLLRREHHAAVVAQARDELVRAQRLSHLDAELQLMNRLGLGHAGLHAWAEALAVQRALAVLARRHGMGYHAALALWNQVQPLLELGDHAAAVRALGFVCTHWKRHYGPLTSAEQAEVELRLAHPRQTLGARRAQSLWDEGAALDATKGLALAEG